MKRNYGPRKEPCLRTGVLLGSLIASLVRNRRARQSASAALEVERSALPLAEQQSSPIDPALPSRDAPSLSNGDREEEEDVCNFDNRQSLSYTDKVASDLDHELGLDLDSFFAELKSHDSCEVENAASALQEELNL